MEEQKSRVTGSLWLNYVMLFLATFSVYASYLSVLGFAAFIFGYILRRYTRKQGLDFHTAHASWQVNTVWLNLLLVVVFTVTLISIMAFMGETASNELNTIADSAISNKEKMLAFWNIPGSRLLLISIFAFSFTLMLWPFQRILHGILALRAGKSPLDPRSGSLPALVLAIIIQACIPVILFLL